MNLVIGPGDPYPFEGKTNPYLDMLKKRGFDMTPPGNRKNFMPAHDTSDHAIANYR